jgi:DNA-binding protein HU-beta
MATQMSKSQLIEKIATITELSKREVKNVMDTLTDVGHKELKKNGLFLVPGFAKFVVVKKPATKARKGTNPFTGEEMMFKAKPARKIVRARPVKAAKDAVEKKGPRAGAFCSSALSSSRRNQTRTRKLCFILRVFDKQ